MPEKLINLPTEADLIKIAAECRIGWAGVGEDGSDFIEPFEEGDFLEEYSSFAYSVIAWYREHNERL